MAYEPSTWVDGPAGNTPLSASRLNRLENGIRDASALAELALAGAEGSVNISGSQILGTTRDFATGPLKIAIAADSTANDSNDWFLTWLRLYAATLPNALKVSYQTWNTTSSVYNTPTVISAGSGVSGSGGVMLSDTFTRTGAVVGSTTDNGVVWAGSGTGWTANGTDATAASGSIAYNLTSKTSSMHLEMSAIAAQTTAISWRAFLGASAVGGPGAGTSIWASITISASGQLAISVLKTVAAVSTSIIASVPATTLGLTNNSASPQNFTVDLSLTGAGVALTVIAGSTVTTRTGTLATEDVAGVGTYGGLLATAGAAGALSARSIQMSIPTVAGVINEVSVLNGAVGGVTLAHQQERIAELYPPGVIDVLVVSGGHNYGVQTPEMFVSAVESFIAVYNTAHPESAIVISSQNPQFSPSTTIAEHAKRQAALRQFAQSRGYDYVPAFEKFAAQTDGGQSWVSDGIHPTTPPANTTDAGYGATLWATAWQTVVASKYLRKT